MNTSENKVRAIGVALTLFALVAAIRITAPSDLYTGDQPKQAAYVRDIVSNSSWLVQHELDGSVASKPPLYNWLAAAPMLVLGQENEFLLKLPSMLAAIATLFMFWDLARRTIGPAPAGFASSFLVLSHLFSKHLYYARADMLLLTFVVMQMWAAVRFEQQKDRRWLGTFYVGAALGMMTKGPIAVMIPVSALLAWWWRRGVLRQRVGEMKFLPGLVLSCIPLAVWFAAAWHVEGRMVYEQLVVAETIDRFASSSSKSKEHRHVFYYVPHLIARMAPWSILAIIASWRREARLLLPLSWVMAPLLLLSLIPSKRADRLLPLLPAVCMLAAVAFERWMVGNSSTPRLNRATAATVWACLVSLASAGIFMLLTAQFSGLLIGAVLTLLASSAVVALLFRRLEPFAWMFLGSLLLAILAYQHLLSDWAVNSS